MKTQPKMHMLVPVGEFPHPSGVVQVIDQAAVVGMSKAFDPSRKVLVDRDHYSDLTNTERAKLAEMGIQLSSEAAGWISDLENRGGGEAISIDFPVGADWLNVPAPLSLKKELKGKVLILDFWTLCCINCLHVLPDLSTTHLADLRQWHQAHWSGERLLHVEP